MGAWAAMAAVLEAAEMSAFGRPVAYTSGSTTFTLNGIEIDPVTPDVAYQAGNYLHMEFNVVDFQNAGLSGPAKGDAIVDSGINYRVFDLSFTKIGGAIVHCQRSA